MWWRDFSLPTTVQFREYKKTNKDQKMSLILQVSGQINIFDLMVALNEPVSYHHDYNSSSRNMNVWTEVHGNP